MENLLAVDDQQKIDVSIKKFTVDYRLSFEMIVGNSSNFYKVARFNKMIFPFPLGKKGQVVVLSGKIFSGDNYYDILAKMNEEGFFRSNLYEGACFSKKFPRVQHELPFFSPARTIPGRQQGELLSPYFSARESGEKILILEDIKNSSKINILGVKIVEVL